MARGDNSPVGHFGGARQAWPFISPAVLLMLAVAAYPIVAAGWLSLHRLIVVFHEEKFSGLANYRALLSDERFWSALRNTFYFAALAVPLELVLGLGLALGLHQKSPFRGALRAAALSCWALPTVVSSKLWAWLFVSLQLDWLAHPAWALPAAILVDVWKTTPFVALLLLAGLQGISEDVYRAARADGASSLRTLVSVTLPLLKPSILLAVLFRLLDALRVFDIVYVLTEGGPGNTTETLSIYAYKTMMRSGDFGYGSTLAVATFLTVMATSIAYLGFFSRRMEGFR
jgi:multiple sugar transport system permease protein